MWKEQTAKWTPRIICSNPRLLPGRLSLSPPTLTSWPGLAHQAVNTGKAGLALVLAPSGIPCGSPPAGTTACTLPKSLSQKQLPLPTPPSQRPNMATSRRFHSETLALKGTATRGTESRSSHKHQGGRGPDGSSAGGAPPSTAALARRSLPPMPSPQPIRTRTCQGARTPTCSSSSLPEVLSLHQRSVHLPHRLPSPAGVPAHLLGPH